MAPQALVRVLYIKMRLQPEVIELRVELSERMRAAQTALLDLIAVTLREFTAANPTVRNRVLKAPAFCNRCALRLLALRSWAPSSSPKRAS